MSLLGAISLTSWTQFRFGPGLELLETYVSDVENDCAASVSAFEVSDEGFERQIGVDEQTGEAINEWVQVHKGLRGDSWSLPHVFRDYFPTLKRASALAMLCSFVEHELNILCEDIQKYLKIGIALGDIHGAGIDRACRYLKVVGNLTLQPEHVAWTQRADIFKIRNAMIHAGGRAGKPDVLKIIQSNKFLSIQGREIAISEGYLAQCISVFSNVGDIVNEGLRNRFEKEIAAKRNAAMKGWHS
ncbi:hypothetical protein CBA19CS22_17990 [Caballeronia novacaledonica]|uniref:Uncharacterized protein n=1 Tax=Caballeronia novacaledonica TaxID=1544861 RepID=A0ACB5QU55_9BURK|nr:hypothetical protein CBA19CS22_17990 [Caballeronia novacaledonica]